jgi:hypothetical protein
MIDDQQDDGAYYGANETRTFISAIPANGLPEIGRNEGADNSEQSGYDEAARISPGRQQLGHHSRQKPNDDRPDKMQHRFHSTGQAEHQPMQAQEVRR